ncbi:hypothetical protein JRO89_XS11G0224700 [Xanthoceras sorbifolium]|uniref:Protein kinase domain-containing protein n=1 Tax=Xanthoceras sorbifolium TaxID=99658 RepID=A0ABQ8HGQ5_9ROSI|nr:hypothetical protein JRO89_XS11G0224700 [Xanthoceras sorbifolium]
MLREKFHSWEECLSLEEIKSLKILRHPNIVLLKEVIRTRDSSLFFVFEYMDGSLLQVMRSRLCRFSENEVRHWCFQVLQGLHYMHENGYFHRDLKPENLLVFKDLIKIGDMGSAREINSSQPCTDNVTTRWYRAPEVMLGLENYSFKVDMWAMGAIVAELFMFKPLFPGTNVPDQMLKICNVLGSPTTDSWLEGLVLASGLNYQFPQSTGSLKKIEKNSMRRIMLRSPPPPSPFLAVAAFAFFWVCIFGLVHVSQAQTNQAQPTTDPDEARALNSMFQQWGISADQQQWNISGEPCSGVATDSSNFDDQQTINPLIKCVCTYNNDTLCHITRL